VSIFTELALYGSKNECARTENVFFPISEYCSGRVSLKLLEVGTCLCYYLHTTDLWLLYILALGNPGMLLIAM
jgi:hypothetical protein